MLTSVFMLMVVVPPDGLQRQGKHQVGGRDIQTAPWNPTGEEQE